MRTSFASRSCAPVTVLVLLACCSLGCELAEPITDAEQIFSVDAQADTLAADGSSTTAVEVQLLEPTPPDAKVTFQVDQGRFAEAPAATPREVTLQASSGRATATYVAENRPGTAVVVVRVGSYVQQERIQLAPLEILALAVAEDTLYADGTSRTQVTVRVRETAPEAAKVRLRVVKGRFAEAAAGSPSELEVVATRGEASVTYVADTQPGVATVTAERGGFVETVAITLLGAQITRLEAERAPLEADGVDRTQVVAQLRGSHAGGTQVTFRTDAGEFAEAPSTNRREAVVNSVDGRAAVTYLAPTSAGTATIVAHAGGAMARTEIRLVPALPAAILLRTNRTEAKANGTEAVLLTAHLLRREGAGAVSRGVRVRFVATDTLGRELPDLANLRVLESETGEVTHTVVSSLVRTVLFRAVVETEGTRVASEPVRVVFTKP